MSLIILRQAIKERKSVSFEYNREGKIKGERIGDPHALYVLRTKDGVESTKIQIVQTSGVTDSEPNFPEFKTFNITDLSDVKIIESTTPFPINDKYKPDSPMYKYVIEKV